MVVDPRALAAKILARMAATSGKQRSAPSWQPVDPKALAQKIKARMKGVGGRGEGVAGQATTRPTRQQVRPAPFSFASGLKPGQLYGFAEIGRGIGFSLAERRSGASVDLGAKAWRGYLDVLDRIWNEVPGGFRLLVDNGAVQEVDLATMTAQAPISDEAWRLRMERYVELARRYGDAVYLITPDRIGDQQETIRRFQICGSKLREAAGFGANLVLVLQPGPVGPVELEARLRLHLVGVSPRQIIPAFPMRQRGDDRTQTVTPLSTVLEFLRERQPEAVHLLGMGPRSSLLAGILRAIRSVAPGIRVMLDAAEVRSVAAEGRPWVEEKPWAEAQVRRRPAYRQGLEIDSTEILGGLDAEQLRAAAEQVGLSGSCVERFVGDPEGMYAILVGWSEDDEGQEDPCFGRVPEQAFDMALQHERFLVEPKFPPQSGMSERDRLLVHRIFRKRGR